MLEPAFDDLLELYRWRFGIEDPVVLDWTGSMRVHPRITDHPFRDVRPNAPARNTVIFGPAGGRLGHPDRSVHLVVLNSSASPATLAEARRVARDAVVIWSEQGQVAAEWLRSPAWAGPEMSLLVTTSDTPDQLEQCLRCIAGTIPLTESIEIVIADAGSGTDGAAVAAAWSSQLRLRHLRTDPARGRNGAVNLGTQAARGDLLAVIGDRTRVLTGWLRPLARTLRDDPGVGVVGGTLHASDGTVVHAGGALFSDGSVTGLAVGSARDDHGAGSVRDVPWVSSGLLATRRGLLLSLGGIDALVGEGYGDVDYCLRVTAAGRRVVHQPQSVATCDPVDGVVQDGAGSFRFRRRWQTRLTTLPSRPAHLDHRIRPAPGNEITGAATAAEMS